MFRSLVQDNATGREGTLRDVLLYQSADEPAGPPPARPGASSSSARSVVAWSGPPSRTRWFRPGWITLEKSLSPAGSPGR